MIDKDYVETLKNLDELFYIGLIVDSKRELMGLKAEDIRSKIWNVFSFTFDVNSDIYMQYEIKIIYMKTLCIVADFGTRRGQFVINDFILENENIVNEVIRIGKSNKLMFPKKIELNYYSDNRKIKTIVSA